MTDPNGGDGGKVPTIEELTGQIDNLNKGIASYRDEAKTAKDEAKTAREEAAQARKDAQSAIDAIKNAKDDSEEEPVKLSPDDQKKLESWAKAQGFVTKEEMDQERQRVFGENLKSIETQAVNEFLEKYPDLNNDAEWKKISDQFALYKQPTSLTAYRTLLNKIRKEIYVNEETTARARAEIETRKRLSLGGGNQKDSSEEAMIDSYAEKYPNLSREQISTRIAEINELAASRAKKQASKK